MTGTAIVVHADAQATLVRMKDTADALSSLVEVLPLQTAEDEKTAEKMVRALVRIRKEGEEARKSVVAPIKARTKEVDQSFAKPREALRALEDKLRARIAEAAERRETTRREAIQAAASAETPKEANTALARIEDRPDARGGVSIRWTWEVASVALESVPVEYLALDLVKVRAAIREAGDKAPEIAGLKFKRKAKTTVRT